MNGPHTRIRVSIAERLIPAIGLAAAASAGIFGAFEMREMFVEAGRSRSITSHLLLAGTSRVETVTALAMAIAAILCFGAAIFSIVRMFAKDRRASPNGLIFIPLALLSLVPSGLLAAALWIPIRAAAGGDEGSAAVAGTDIAALSLLAIGIAVLVILALAAFTFVPLRARAGRRYSPTIAMVLVGLAFAVIAIVFYWAAYASEYLSGHSMLS